MVNICYCFSAFRRLFHAWFDVLCKRAILQILSIPIGGVLPSNLVRTVKIVSSVLINVHFHSPVFHCTDNIRCAIYIHSNLFSVIFVLKCLTLQDAFTNESSFSRFTARTTNNRIVCACGRGQFNCKPSTCFHSQ